MAASETNIATMIRKILLFLFLLACLVGPLAVAQNTKTNAPLSSAERKKLVKQWKSLVADAKKADEEKKYREAADLYSAALLAAKDLGAEGEHWVETSLDLARLYCRHGGFSLAEPLARTALSGQEKRLGTNDVEVAATLLLLGETCEGVRKFEEAAQCFLRAKDICGRELGATDLAVGVCLNRLGTLYLRQDKDAEAEQSFTNALAIFRRTNVDKDPNLGTKSKGLGFRDGGTITFYYTNPNLIGDSLYGLGCLCQKQLKTTAAEACFQNALKIFENKQGKNSLGLVPTLTRLGIVHALQKDYAKAELAWKRALAIGEKNLGSNHPQLIPTLNCLAGLYREQNKPEEADKLEKRSAQLRSKGANTGNSR